MNLLYQSDHFIVLHLGWREAGASDEQSSDPAPTRDGYEIVDKRTRQGIFIEGELAQQFRAGAQALAGASPQLDEDALDDYLARFTALAPAPLQLH